MSSTSRAPSEATATSARPVVFCLARLRCGEGSWRSFATGDGFCIKHSADLGFVPVAGKDRGWCRTRREPRSMIRRRNADERSGAERRLVQRNLLFATELIGQLLPRRGDVVGAGLRVVLAGEHFCQLVLRDAVVLEDARNARLDRPVWVIVGAELRVEIGGDVLTVIARVHPFVDLEMV